jgi:hypothetical protein
MKSQISLNVEIAINLSTYFVLSCSETGYADKVQAVPEHVFQSSKYTLLYCQSLQFHILILIVTSNQGSLVDRLTKLLTLAVTRRLFGPVRENWTITITKGRSIYLRRRVTDRFGYPDYHDILVS